MIPVELYVEKREGTPVNSGEAVVFDHPVHTVNIDYDAITGRATTVYPGLYTVWWWVSVQNSPSTGKLTFSLVTEDGAVFHASSDKTSGLVFGMATLDVIQGAPVTFYVRCDGDGTAIPLAGTTVKAAMMATFQRHNAYGGRYSNGGSFHLESNSQLFPLPLTFPSKRVL